MNKAIEIKREMVRLERAELLEALDVEYMRAAERQDVATLAKIAIRKQALRDATDDPAILKAKTPDELKAAQPSAIVAERQKFGGSAS